MNNLLGAGPADATPLTDAERQGLRLPVDTRAELNFAESVNVNQAREWLFLSGLRLRPDTVTDEEWLRRLHWRMYRRVWEQAGCYRTCDTNLGVPYWQVRVDIRNLLEDVQTWLAVGRYDADECAIRFGYRLVSDALVVALGGRWFTWSGGVPVQAGTRDWSTSRPCARRTSRVTSVR
jgi:fido (protein-threonine AMPylation protein)